MTSSFTQFKNDMTQTSNLKTINTHLGDLKKNITQDGLGGGTACGVMIDSVSSKLGDVKDNSTLTASRLNNIQNWVGTQDGAGGGTKLGVMVDGIDSSCNTIESNSTLQASRLNNIQNYLTQDGAGGGTKLGQIADGIDSSCNTIESNSTLTASRLNNIQNYITQGGDGSGTKLGQMIDATQSSCSHIPVVSTKLTDGSQICKVMGNTASDGSGTAKHLKTSSDGELIVNFEAGDLNIGNVDVESLPSAMVSSNQLKVTNTQLPASLGAKADSASLSVVRSSDTGSFDLSARTTIGTAGTSTKLLCSSAGILSVVKGHRQVDSTHISGLTISASSAGATLALGDTTDYVRYNIEKASGLVSNFTIQGSNDNTNWISIVEPEFESYTSTGLLFSSTLIHPCPPYVRLYNGDASSSIALTKIATQYGGMR